MLSKDALEIVLSRDPDFSSHLFLVEKVTGRWRPVIDLSHLNEFVRLTPFKVETVASVFLSVRVGDFLASINLKDAYFQIPVHQSSRKLLRFLSDGTVPVQGPVLRTVDCPAGLHQGVCSGLCLGTLPRDSSSQVPQRLAGPRLFGDGGQTARPGPSLALSLPQDSDKQGEVPSHTLADCKLPRYDHRYRGHQHFSVPCAGQEISVGGGDVLCFVHSPRSALAGDLGSPGFIGEAGSAQSTSNALSAVAFEDALVSRVGSYLPPGGLVPGGEGGFVLVDGAGLSPQGGSIRDTRSGFTPVLGQVSVGVGRTPPRSCRVQGVVGVEVAAHQSSQNESFVSGTAVISGVGRRSPCDRDMRHLDGGGLHQQTGRDGLLFPLLVGQPASEVDRESRHPPRRQVSTRAVQCSGRSPQLSGSGYRDRVVSTGRWLGPFFVVGARRRSICSRRVSA